MTAGRSGEGRARLSISVRGTVQGVGFRPFARNLAVSLGLTGSVGNDNQGAHIEAEGPEHELATFLQRLRDLAPPLCQVEATTVKPLQLQGGHAFVIVPSTSKGERQALIPPDTATCDDCLAEMWDPRDRRYLFPFINCTNCGPRFTIIKGVPYDRANTTMAAFTMCAQCLSEYEDPTDRRYHAEPTCCPVCGPSLRLRDSDGALLAGPESAVRDAVAVLRRGQVLAIKGLGGYHLAALASSEMATSSLRARKHREAKAFAVMVPDLAVAAQLCQMSPLDCDLLSGPQRPIVVMARHREGPAPGVAGLVAPSVAPGHHYLGLMLPYTPVHHLLAGALGEPFVLTSGNLSDEPIVYNDDEARERLHPVADAFLAHDRAVHVRADDSVVRVVGGASQVVRRSRGYAPQPMALPHPVRRPLLACGAELKSTFCLAKEGRAFLSQHIGNLANFEAWRSFREGVEHYCRLFEVRPELVAYDLHPEYLSTKYALSLEGVDHIGVQHHHAHLASCLVDNDHTGPVVGIAMDGLGYGDDGTLWGGEAMVASLAGYHRAGHLSATPMPGGVSAIREPWRMAVPYLDRAFEGTPPERLAVARRHADQWATVLKLSEQRAFSPLTSSAGRLFDAVASIVAGRDEVSYEGQAAVELEQLAEPDEEGYYPVPMRFAAGKPFEVSCAGLVRFVADDILSGISPAVVAARFHNTMARVVLEMAIATRLEGGGLSEVALSGGVFQNRWLTTKAVPLLGQAGFNVLTHSRVPCNDGGVSLGQAAIAGTLDLLDGPQREDLRWLYP